MRGLLIAVTRREFSIADLVLINAVSAALSAGRWGMAAIILVVGLVICVALKVLAELAE